MDELGVSPDATVRSLAELVTLLKGEQEAG